MFIVQAGAIMEKKCLQSYRSLIMHSLQISLTSFFILLALLVVNAWQGMKDLPALVASLEVIITIVIINNSVNVRYRYELIYYYYYKNKYKLTTISPIKSYTELLGTDQYGHVVDEQHQDWPFLRFVQNRLCSQSRAGFELSE